MKIGILGAGKIAHTMAATLIQMKNNNIELYAVASSSYEKSRTFAQEYHIAKAYGSYEELVKDPDVELIYIATIHTMHYAHALLCIENHKHVLVEKPLTICHQQAQKLFAKAKENNVFISEAMWTRFMPSAAFLQNIQTSQLIGDVNSIDAHIGYRLNDVQRMVDPSCGGGALLDIGIYLLHFAMMVFSNNVRSVEGSCLPLSTGVDAIDSITMQWDNHLATLQATMLSDSDNHGYIYGSKGYLKVDNINNPHKIEHFDRSNQLIDTYDFSDQITGYEYEMIAAVQAIQEHQLESSFIPHTLTLQVLQYMDQLRQQWSIHYPQEQ